MKILNSKLILNERSLISVKRTFRLNEYTGSVLTEPHESRTYEDSLSFSLGLILLCAAVICFAWLPFALLFRWGLFGTGKAKIISFLDSLGIYEITRDTHIIFLALLFANGFLLFKPGHCRKRGVNK